MKKNERGVFRDDVMIVFRKYNGSCLKATLGCTEQTVTVAFTLGNEKASTLTGKSTIKYAKYINLHGVTCYVQ